jgi:hypothetical protein
MFIHNWGSKKECSILKGLQNAILDFYKNQQKSKIS